MSWIRLLRELTGANDLPLLNIGISSRTWAQALLWQTRSPLYEIFTWSEILTLNLKCCNTLTVEKIFPEKSATKFKQITPHNSNEFCDLECTSIASFWISWTLQVYSPPMSFLSTSSIKLVFYDWRNSVISVIGLTMKFASTSSYSISHGFVRAPYRSLCLPFEW